jgi:hypothetical protein
LTKGIEPPLKLAPRGKRAEGFNGLPLPCLAYPPRLCWQWHSLPSMRSCPRPTPHSCALPIGFGNFVECVELTSDSIPGATKLANIARHGFSGHHYAIMALCIVVASFLVNALFATKPGESVFSLRGFDLDKKRKQTRSKGLR